MVSLERKFDADENSYKKHGLKMSCSEVMLFEIMSRDQGSCIPI